MVALFAGVDMGVLWVLKHHPLSQDNVQASIDIASSSTPF